MLVSERVCHHVFRFKQGGAALILFVSLLLLVAITAFFTNFDSSQYMIERQKITTQALAEAKAALTGRAIMDSNHPGSLPCPDNDDDGSAELFIGNNCPTYIGRLPWRTLGTGDLRDAYGERLWYALSRNHRDHSSAQPINLNTPSTLTIDGVVDYEAVVFSAGPPLSDQSRPSNQVSDYLEGENANGDDVYTVLVGSNANDTLTTISRSELMDKVALRILREIRGSSTQGLIHYYNTGGNNYPFADIDGDGISNADGLTGTPSYQDLLNQSLFFEDDTKEMLIDNGWLPHINYSIAVDKQTVILGLGVNELVVVP